MLISRKLNFTKILIQSIRENNRIQSIKINSILGTRLDNKKIIKILNNLFFETIENKVRVPSFRNDILNENDIAEEIAGYRIQQYTLSED